MSAPGLEGDLGWVDSGGCALIYETRGSRDLNLGPVGCFQGSGLRQTALRGGLAGGPGAGGGRRRPLFTRTLRSCPRFSKVGCGEEDDPPFCELFPNRQTWGRGGGEGRREAGFISEI